MYRAAFPQPPGKDNPVSDAILERRTVNVPDIMASAYSAGPKERARAIGYRSILVVPMMREDVPIGAITVGRAAPEAFSEAYVALLKTFADQAVIAIENVRLFNETKEALERQTATSEVLEVMSRSQTDLQPVFDSIATNAMRLCEGDQGMVFSYDGERMDLVGLKAMSPEEETAARWLLPAPPDRGKITGRAILTRAVAQSVDVLSDAEYQIGSTAQVGGWRSVLSVPMLRAGEPIGAITVTRHRPMGFTENQMALLKTFADQAVIAIENVRLFNETKEALEQQTATADILKVISGSLTDLQPVFDTICSNAVRLAKASAGFLISYDGAAMDLAAQYNVESQDASVYRSAFPRPARRDSVTGRAALDRAVINIPDIWASDFGAGTKDRARRAGYRSALAVPLLRAGVPIGVLYIVRGEVGAFPDSYVGLLQTFAAQAVIAIENVRLFNETKEALKKQTATAEILGVISSTPTDTLPVFEAIVHRATMLCEAVYANVFRYDGEQLHLITSDGWEPELVSVLKTAFPAKPDRSRVAGRVVLDRQAVRVEDTRLDPDYDPDLADRLRYRRILGVPLLRSGEVVGVITVRWAEPGPIEPRHEELLKTFAAQAVIAIENVRLFKEVEARTEALSKSVGQLTALSEVGQAISSSLELETVLKAIVARAVQLTELDAGSIYEYDEAAEEFRLQAAEHMEEELVDAVRTAPIRKGDGATGRTAVTLEAIQVPDIEQDSYTGSRKEVLLRAGYRALLAVPLLREGRLLGALLVNRKAPGAFAPEVVELLKTFATQSALAIQNARLFREIAEKSAQLEVANKHKSDFLANMSHELRTPLNAIIGFSEVMIEQMFGELNEKQLDYQKDIHESGKHLLSLINDILDLSKIEAGRMELELSSFHLPTAVSNAVTLIRERAQRHGIALGVEVDPRLGDFQADERKVKQILLNLLSNAVKFTPDGGRVDVTAKLDTDKVEIAVKDTGVGIAPEDQASLFEEFKQFGNDRSRKAEGTGLGLALTRRLVELHGGQIAVDSAVGQGSTFRFSLPLQR
jgi:GAF domain-containing protein